MLLLFRDSVGRIQAGERKWLLDDIERWVNLDGEAIRCYAAPARWGKTAVATYLIRQWGSVVGSVEFTSGDPSSTDPRRSLLTLCYLAASTDAETTQKLADPAFRLTTEKQASGQSERWTLQDAITSGSPEYLLEHLLFDSILSSQSGKRIIVLDGLDALPIDTKVDTGLSRSMSGEGTPKTLLELLSCIARGEIAVPANVKILCFSREDDAFRLAAGLREGEDGEAWPAAGDVQWVPLSRGKARELAEEDVRQASVAEFRDKGSTAVVEEAVEQVTRRSEGGFGLLALVSTALKGQSLRLEDAQSLASAADLQVEVAEEAIAAREHLWRDVRLVLAVVLAAKTTLPPDEVAIACAAYRREVEQSHTGGLEEYFMALFQRPPLALLLNVSPTALTPRDARALRTLVSRPKRSVPEEEGHAALACWAKEAFLAAEASGTLSRAVQYGGVDSPVAPSSTGGDSVLDSDRRSALFPRYLALHWHKHVDAARPPLQDAQLLRASTDLERLGRIERLRAAGVAAFFHGTLDRHPSVHRLAISAARSISGRFLIRWSSNAHSFVVSFIDARPSPRLMLADALNLLFSGEYDLVHKADASKRVVVPPFVIHNQIFKRDDHTIALTRDPSASDVTFRSLEHFVANLQNARRLGSPAMAPTN